MKNLFFSICLVTLSLTHNAFAQWQVSSPSGKIRATVQLAGDGKLSYTVDFIENAVTTNAIKSSPLGITRNDQDFTSNLSIETVSNEVIDDRYTMLTGKQSSLWNHANQLTLNCKNANNAKLQLIFRAYDDGVAFRYRFTDNSTQNVNILSENTGFSLPMGGKGWLSKNAIQPDYQQYYVETPIGNNAPDGYGWNFPALFQSNSFWYLISESGIDESNSVAHLAQVASNGTYKIAIPEQNDGNNYNAFTTVTLPNTMPWRLIILGKNLSNIVESSLVNHLADASKITNTSWIKPGISSWSWWSDFSSPKDYNKLKAFVDFSKTQGLPYTLVDENWNQMTGGDLTQLAQYAQNQGVGLWVWYNSAGQHNNLTDDQPRDKMSDPNIRQAEMLKLKNMGVKGIKVDFFLSDKQPLIKQYLDILKDAASYELMVNFHGCTLPRGWQRTYPNLMAMEAVSGDEQLLFNPGDFRSNSAAHNVNLVFTRNVVGSMDYTPAIVGTERVTHNTSTAHELALLALFESGVTHWADKISNYQGLNATALKAISQIPTTWDETHLLQGDLGKYVFLARKKGDNWYVSGINGTGSALSTHFGIPYLDASGTYSKLMISDGSDARSLNVAESTYIYGKEESINLQPYGGFLIILKKAPCSLSKPVITKTENAQGITLSTATTASSIQWLLNQTAIAGATASSFSPKQVGNYAVKISDTNCSVVSDEMTISIEKPVIILSGKNPACAGDSVKLQVSQSYDQLKWYLDEVDLKLSTNVITVRKSGSYKAIGTKSKIDSEFSDAIILTFNPLPQKPTVVSSAGILKTSSTSNLQWSFNGTDISGATSTSYTPTKDGNYAVRTTENGCSTTSDNFVYKNTNKLSITVTGKNPACEGDSVILTTNSGFDTYLWTLQGNNASILNSKNSITIKKSGVYQVVGSKAGVSQSSDTLRVTFYAYPAKPNIFLVQNTLQSSSTSGNQWYADGTQLAGETNQTLSKFNSRIYVVKVTQNGCTTASEPFVITSLSSGYENKLLKIYPNPTEGKLTVSFGLSRNISLIVYDLNGVILLEQQLKDNADAATLDLSNFHSGIYLLKVSTEKWTSVEKVFVK